MTIFIMWNMYSGKSFIGKYFFGEKSWINIDLCEWNIVLAIVVEWIGQKISANSMWMYKEPQEIVNVQYWCR